MGIFNLLDSLSKSFEKRATLGYSKSLSVSHSATATLTSQGQGMRTLEAEILKLVHFRGQLPSHMIGIHRFNNRPSN